MTAISNLPANKNFLSPLGFTFSIKKTPGVNYFVQSASIPGFSLGTVDFDTPFVKIPYPGDHIAFEPLNITFRVDEEMRNYFEIFSWMKATGFPDEFNQYQSMSDIAKYRGTAQKMTGEGQFSDASLIILNSVKAPIIEVTFTDLFPTTLSEISFDTRNTDVDYIDATVTFSYRKFDLNYI